MRNLCLAPRDRTARGYRALRDSIALVVQMNSRISMSKSRNGMTAAHAERQSLTVAGCLIRHLADHDVHLAHATALDLGKRREPELRALPASADPGDLQAVPRTDGGHADGYAKRSVVTCPSQTLTTIASMKIAGWT